MPVRHRLGIPALEAIYKGDLQGLEEPALALTARLLTARLLTAVSLPALPLPTVPIAAFLLLECATLLSAFPPQAGPQEEAAFPLPERPAPLVACPLPELPMLEEPAGALSALPLAALPLLEYATPLTALPRPALPLSASSWPGSTPVSPLKPPFLAHFTYR
ncbi:UNVERIFIED_CONTAM: hypothetical protein FKN15_017470 [Acipenser sinensis]